MAGYRTSSEARGRATRKARGDNIMAQIVPTQNGYIDTDPFGFKQAQQVGMQMQERADQHQAFLTDQVMKNQNMSVQDIMNHLNLAKTANPVDAQGNVQATPDVPAS